VPRAWSCPCYDGGVRAGAGNLCWYQYVVLNLLLPSSRPVLNFGYVMWYSRTMFVLLFMCYISTLCEMLLCWTSFMQCSSLW
jgi:hypothetical protein